MYVFVFKRAKLMILIKIFNKIRWLVNSFLKKFFFNEWRVRFYIFTIHSLASFFIGGVANHYDLMIIFYISVVFFGFMASFLSDMIKTAASSTIEVLFAKLVILEIKKNGSVTKQDLERIGLKING